MTGLTTDGILCDAFVKSVAGFEALRRFSPKRRRVAIQCNFLRNFESFLIWFGHPQRSPIGHLFYSTPSDRIQTVLTNTTLIITHQLRVDIENYDVIKIDASSSSVEVTFKKDANIDAVKLIDLIQSDKAFRMNGPDKIKVMVTIDDLNKRSTYIKKLLSDVV